MQLRIPLLAPPGERLRVCLYARFSTDEQDASSITDQFAEGDRFLKLAGITDAMIDRISDEEMSGELVDRPGINEVKDGTNSHRWHLVWSEDSSRLFRNHTACFGLVEAAVDEDIRVICSGDYVDTAEEGWEARLNDAQRQHCEANRFTRARLLRKMRGLWNQGAAIGLLKPGYLRRSRDFSGCPDEDGPKFDEIDPAWRDTVYEAYERVANGDPAWLVANWLTSKGLRKCSNSTSADWTERNVIALIRRDIYRGRDTYRATIQKRKRRTGKKRPIRNAPEEVWKRDMPHLRIVPDWLWEKANAIIDERATRPGPPHGKDHPLFGVPRDSRGPLSGLLTCFCGGKIYSESTNGYRCSRASKGMCWNRGTANQALTHQRISEAIVSHLLNIEGHFDSLVDFCADLRHSDAPFKEELDRFRQEERGLQKKCESLLRGIETTALPPSMLVEQLAARELELKRLRSRIDELTAKTSCPRPAPTRDQVEQSVRAVASKVIEMDQEARVAIRSLLDGGIVLVPYQLLHSNLVVLRAEFRISVTRMLPDELLRCLHDTGRDPIAELMPPHDVRLDLFMPSSAPANAARAHELATQKPKLTLEQIGVELGIKKRAAHLAVQLGKKMHLAGINDPYIRLTECPPSASRWRQQRRSQK